MNVQTNCSLTDKKPEKLTFWGYYSKAKKDDCNQGNLSFLDDFDRFILWAITYFLEVCSGVSLKLTTEIYGTFWGKQISKISISEVIIPNQNEEVNQNNLYFVMISERSVLFLTS